MRVSGTPLLGARGQYWGGLAPAAASRALVRVRVRVSVRP